MPRKILRGGRVFLSAAVLFVFSASVFVQAEEGGASSPLKMKATAEQSTQDPYAQLRLFGDVLDRVHSEYVQVPDQEKLIEAAINGMLISLDPHSSYMPPDAFEDMQIQTKGEFGGLGIEVTMENGFVKVITPIDDTPAYRAGIRAGDLITQLNGESIQGLTLNQAVDRMRGAVKTPITLTLIRQGVEEPIEITLIRDVIKIQSVRWEKIEDVGYLRITQFNQQTFPKLKEGVRALKKEIPAQELKGFIVDLRNNPGGLLDQAIAVSDAFLDQGEIVSVRGRNIEDAQRFNAKLGDLADGRPLIVLINGGSASASEIVAGALQDQRRATILGTRSFGKGSVQTIIPIDDKRAIRLTTALYYTPSSRSIQAKGIEPDIEILQVLSDELKGKTETRGEAGLRGHLGVQGEGEEKNGSQAYVPRERSEDTQLLHAIELLRGTKKNAAFPANPNADLPYLSRTESF